jgi:GntR family galactonate operon transcriptional repressor
MLTKPRRDNLSTQVTNNLGRWILSGKAQPGDVLPQEENLCTQLGVSRTVVREAVKSLAAKGMVDSKPRRGTIVRPKQTWNYLDPQVLEWLTQEDSETTLPLHLTELRKALEPTAAELAATRASDEDLLIVQSAYQTMANNTEDVEAFLAADLAFHIAILHATGNPLFIPIANVVQASLHASLRITNRTTKDNILSLPLHKEIATALQARDATRARQAMLTHMEDTAGRLGNYRREF